MLPKSTLKITSFLSKTYFSAVKEQAMNTQRTTMSLWPRKKCRIKDELLLFIQIYLNKQQLIFHPSLISCRPFKTCLNIVKSQIPLKPIFVSLFRGLYDRFFKGGTN